MKLKGLKPSTTWNIVDVLSLSGLNYLHLIPSGVSTELRESARRRRGAGAKALCSVSHKGERLVGARVFFLAHTLDVAAAERVRCRLHISRVIGQKCLLSS